MNSQWLSTLFETYPEKTKKSLADFLGMELPAVSKMLNGTRQIKAEEYIGMRTFFNLPMDGEHALETQRQSYVTSNEMLNHNFAEGNDSENQWDDSNAILQKSSNIIYKKTMVIENMDDYMAPEFDQGQIVLVDLEMKEPVTADLFVVSDGMNYMVRECEMVSGANGLQVKVSAKKQGFISQILDIDEVYILGRVVGKATIR